MGFFDEWWSDWRVIHGVESWLLSMRWSRNQRYLSERNLDYGLSWEIPTGQIQATRKRSWFGFAANVGARRISDFTHCLPCKLTANPPAAGGVVEPAVLIITTGMVAASLIRCGVVGAT